MNHLTHAGAGAYSAVSPAGSYGSYHRTNTASSLEDGSRSGRASGVSSGMMGSDSSRVSEFLSETSRVMGVIESGGYGTQYAVEDGSRGDLLVREGHRERVPGRGEAVDDHGQMQAWGAGHAHSTSLSTVTGSPPQPQGGPSAVPIGAAFAGPSFGLGSGHQVQPGYPVRPSDTHYRPPPRKFSETSAPPKDNITTKLPHMQRHRQHLQTCKVARDIRCHRKGWDNLKDKGEPLSILPVLDPLEPRPSDLVHPNVLGQI